MLARNDAEGPVILWLCKDGPPAEGGWLTPGQFAALYPPDDDLDSDLAGLPSVVLQPGETARLGPRVGRFGRQTQPILRVYHGVEDLNGMAAVPRRDERVDEVTLVPGLNHVAVRRVEPVQARRVPPETFAGG